LMTFTEFERLPDPHGGRYELIRGGLLLRRPLVWKLFTLRRELQKLLEVADHASAGCVGTAFGFRPHDEREYYICDVAWVSQARWQATDRNSYFQGAPELVVEILSPSNTLAEMLEKEQVCLATGAREFWLVDDDRRQVKVSTPDGHTITYKSGQAIPLFFTEGGSLNVDQIFG
jgi:Uma2 family endonuclease